MARNLSVEGQHLVRLAIAGAAIQPYFACDEQQRTEGDGDQRMRPY